MDKYFDAHTHLQMMSDVEQVIQTAEQKKVTNFICNSTGPNDWETVLQISKKHPNVYPCLGVHPHYIDNLPNDWDKQLEKLLIQHPKAMVGEIGLDKLKPDLDKQEAILRIQLKLAYCLNRPVHIHCVRSWDRLLHIFKIQHKKMPPKLLMHSHHGNADLIQQLIENYNAYFSYSAIFVPNNHPKVQACLKATPLNRLMIESDAPDLTDHPADIVELTEKMSIITGHKISDLKKVLFENAKEFVNGN